MIDRGVCSIQIKIFAEILFVIRMHPVNLLNGFKIYHFRVKMSLSSYVIQLASVI